MTRLRGTGQGHGALLLLPHELSLCFGTLQLKARQDEEKKQLCALRDQLKAVLQLEQKEVKPDPSSQGSTLTGCRLPCHSFPPAQSSPSCLLVSSWLLFLSFC